MGQLLQKIWWTIKVLTIMAVSYIAYQSYGEAMFTVIADDMSTPIEKASDLIRIVFDISEPAINDSEDEVNIEDITTPTLPNKLKVQNQEAYNYGRNIADSFNAVQDPIAITQAFNSLPTDNNNLPAKTIDVGVNLLQGAKNRVRQLADNHYFSNLTKDGQDFRTLYTEIPNSQYRIGEQLYELYLIADDVRLQAWHQPDILAKFLNQALGKELNAKDFTYQLITVRLAPTTYTVKGVPYVRLVAVRTFYR